MEHRSGFPRSHGESVVGLRLEPSQQVLSSRHCIVPIVQRGKLRPREEESVSPVYIISCNSRSDP